MKLNDEHKKLLIKIGSLCKENRKMRGYTIEELSKEVNVPICEISKFENGMSNNAVLYNWYLGTEFD